MKKRLLFCLSLALCALTTVKAEEVDYTSSITNAEMASLDGWTSTGSTSSSYGDGLVKLGSGSDYNFYQTITLPAGQYKVTAQAAYRYASGSVNVAEQAEYAAIQAGTDTHLAKFYAQTATYKYETGVQNRWDGRSETDYFSNLEKVSVIEHESVTYYVPNSSAAVKAWFDNGKYVNELVFNVQEEGEVTIGIVKTVGAPNGDYTNVGAWTLTRIGDAEADPEVEEEVVTPENPKDMTSLVGTSKDAWVGATGTYSNCVEHFIWGGTSTGEYLSQTISGLPKGLYEAVLYCAASSTSSRDNGGATPVVDGDESYVTLSANNVSVGIPSYNRTGIDGEIPTYTLSNIVVTEDGTLKFLVNINKANPNWIVANIKSLKYFGVDLEALKDAFSTRLAEFDVYGLDNSWNAINGVYYWPVYDEAHALDLDKATEDDLDALMAKMDAAEDSLEIAYAAGAEHAEMVALLESAIGYSAMLNEEKCMEAHSVYQANSSIGYSASSVEAIEEATANLEAAYVLYVANAVPTEGNMFDVTFHLQNPNFESNIDGWTTNKANRIGGEGYDGVGGIAEIGDWNASSWDASMSQDITGLPNGKYMVKMAWMAEIGIKMTFAANDSIVEVTGIGATGGNIAKDGSVVEMGSGHRGWQYAEVVGRVMDGTLTIKVSSSSTVEHMWSNADAFELYYVDTIPGATDEQKLAFAAALATAEAHTLGFAVGEYAPYTNVEAAKALAAAQAIDLEGDVVAETLTAVQAALEAAVWTANTEEMNAIYDGTFAADYSGQTGNVKPTGWNRTSGTNTGYEVRYMALPEGVSTTGYGMFIKFTANYGKEEGYTMPLKANTAYKLSFDYAGWGNNPTVSVLVKDVDGNELTVVPNSITATSNAGNSDASVWQSYEGEFTTGDADTDYILYFDKSESDQLQIAFANFQLYEVKGIVDAIDAPAVQPAEAVIYDLQGRRVAKMEKGIYIVNGVKVMVK